MPIPEQKTQENIDALLKRAGWVLRELAELSGGMRGD